MLKINHIGYAVKKLDRAVSQMEDIGYKFGNMVADQDRRIWIVFGRKDGYQIELISPISKGSPIDKILKNSGPTPYHICYESDCFDADIEQLTCGGGGIKS